MQNIKAIIFDIDDTLVQTIQCKWLALKATAKKFYNLQLTDEHINKFWGLPFQKMLMSIFLNIDSFDEIKKHYIKTSDSFPMKAHQGTVEVINKLKDTFLIAALTSSSRSVILKDLVDSKFNLKDFFFIQTSEYTTCHKPDPKVFVPILTKLEKRKIIKKNIVYVGDGLRDCEASNKAGLYFTAVTTGLTTKQDFEKAGVKKEDIINNLHQLLDILNINNSTPPR